MTDQITDSPFKGAKFQENFTATDIDLKALENTQQPYVDKMQTLIAHYESANRTLNDPNLKNLIAALSLLKAEASIQFEVYQQRDQQHQSLIQTLQHRFQKERQEFSQQQEQTERVLQQKLRVLEQELQVAKRQVTKQSIQEEDLNAEVLQELENMEVRYKLSDEELRAENLHLKKQLAVISKQSREFQSQLLASKQKLEVKSCEEFTLLKRLEDTLKLIRGEVRQAHKLLETSETSQTFLNVNQEDHFNLTVSEVPEMSIQLQRELDQAYREIEMLRQSDITDIWQQKIELIEREKKMLTEEIQKISKAFQSREQSLLKEIKSSQTQIKLINKAQSERENQLEYEVLEAKTQLRDVISSINVQPLQLNLSQSNLNETDFQLLSNENEHLKSHNKCLRSQLQEALIQLGKFTNVVSANIQIDKQLQQSSHNNKICQKLDEICSRFNITFEKLELLAADYSITPINDQTSNQVQNEIQKMRQLEEVNFLQRQELSNAKKSLLMYINKCNHLEDLLDSELLLDSSQIQRILVKKFAEEIKMLKQEKIDIVQAKDLQIIYYKEQMDYLQDEQNSNKGSRPFDQLKNDLKQLLSELKHQLNLQTDIETRSAQEKRNNLLQKKASQTAQVQVKEGQNTQKMLVYEEVSMLREQLDQISQQYASHLQHQKSEIKSLERAKSMVQKREEQLVNCIKSILKVQVQFGQRVNTDSMNALQQNTHQQLQSEVEMLQIKLRQIEQTSQQECEEKISVLAQKLQLVADQRDVIERELKQIKVQSNVQNEPKRILQQENERLRQHIQARQKEMLEMRSKTQLLSKQLRQKADDFEKEQLKKYKDRLSGHLKVFDLELNKLCCILQEL